MKVHIEPWREGQSSIYAIVREGVCLIDRFFDELEEYREKHAIDLASFITMITREPHIRPGFLRPELPNHGVYAMYSEKEALFLAEVIKQVNARVDHGEIEIVGSSLIPRYADSLHFDT